MNDNPAYRPCILYFTALFLCFAIIQYYHAIFETLRGYICEVNCFFHCFSCGYLTKKKFIYAFIYIRLYIYLCIKKIYVNYLFPFTKLFENLCK